MGGEKISKRYVDFLKIEQTWYINSISPSDNLIYVSDNSKL